MSIVNSPLSIHTSYNANSTKSIVDKGMAIDTKLEHHQFISIIGSPPGPSGFLKIYANRSTNDHHKLCFARHKSG
jgi:hypothetical protein